MRLTKRQQKDLITRLERRIANQREVINMLKHQLRYDRECMVRDAASSAIDGWLFARTRDKILRWLLFRWTTDKQKKSPSAHKD